MPYSAHELALHCAWVVDQKGGTDVVVMELPGQGGSQSGHAVDYAVLVTAGSERLTNALVEEVWLWCKQQGVARKPVEGEAGWMLIDCYDVVVHAFSEEKRAFYHLEELWRMGRKIDWEKERKALVAPVAKKTPAKKSKKADAVEAVEETESSAEEVVEAKPSRARRAKTAPAAVVAEAEAAPEAEAEAKPVAKRPKKAPRVKHNDQE